MQRRMIPLAGVLVASALVLSGCGYHPTDRALTGGLLGAGAGAVIGAAAGDAGAGALIGGATGAVAGAITRPDQIYLGEPIWRP